jgi:hypothetical protein
MQTRLPQVEETSVALATYLAVCAFACGLAVFGFYMLMQPERNANPGIAAYTPPPRTVINYPVAARFTPNQRAASSPATDVLPTSSTDETTGRAIQAEATPQTVDPPSAIGTIPAPAEASREESGSSAAKFVSPTGAGFYSKLLSQCSWAVPRLCGGPLKDERTLSPLNPQTFGSRAKSHLRLSPSEADCFSPFTTQPAVSACSGTGTAARHKTLAPEPRPSMPFLSQRSTPLLLQ